MAYKRKTKARKSYSRTRRGGYSARRRPVRSTRRARKRRSSSAPRTVKIVIEQAPANGLSPMQQSLLDEGKVVTKRRARF